MKTKTTEPVTDKGLPAHARVMTLTQVRKVADESTDDNPVYELSFSSDTAVVPRWWGNERLSHEPGAVDLTRMNSGAAPFLVNHDPDQLVGTVVPNSARIADGKGYAKVRLGRSALAREIGQDMEDGIRPNVSVQYIIRELTSDPDADGDNDLGEDNDDDSYLVTRWEPLEISTVSVPADPTVGLGRSEDGKRYPVALKRGGAVATAQEERVDMSTTAGAAAAAAVVDENAVRTSAVQSERDRIAYIRKLTGELRLDSSLTDKWISDGTSIDQVRQETLDILGQRSAKNAVTPVETGMTEREDRQYSIVRAIRHMAAAAGHEGIRDTDAGFELEMSREIEKKIGRAPAHGGIYIPTRGLKVNHVDGVISESVRKRMGEMRTLNIVGGQASGGALVATELMAQDFIELLRNLMYVRRAGATVFSDLRDNIAFPKQTGPGTLVWTTENAAAIAPADSTFGQVPMSPKTAMSATSFTRQLLAQSSLDIEMLVRQDIAAIHALGIDLAAINGTGTGGQPTGVLNQSGINIVAIGTNGGNPSWSNIVDCETDLLKANLPITNPAWITTPGMKGTLRKTAKLGNTIGLPIWEDGDTMLGYQAFATNQVPSNLTKGTGTNLHAIIFGEWQHLFIGEWGVLEIVVDPYSSKRQGIIELASFQMVDIAVRYPVAFTAIVDALPL